jgi:uncharacterized protein (DUF433 family)
VLAVHLWGRCRPLHALHGARDVAGPVEVHEGLGQGVELRAARQRAAVGTKAWCLEATVTRNFFWDAQVAVTPLDYDVSMGARQQAEEERLALPLSGASRLVGVAERRLINWEAIGLVTPSTTRTISERNTVRLYDFNDLLALMVIRELFDRKMSTYQIHRVVEHLKSTGYDRPLTQLRFATEGSEIYFQHPNGTWEGDRNKNQIVFYQILDMRLLRQQLWQSIREPRPERLHGQTVKRRRVHGSKPVFSGTRTPVSALIPYLERGYTTARILKAFPELRSADVETARDEFRKASA